MFTIREMNSKDINNKPEDDKEFLENLGYNEWFDKKSKEYQKEDYSIARIVEVNRNNYKINNGRDEIVAELSGKYLFTIDNNIDYPTVGDWVVVQCFDDYSLAIIHHLLPRKSLMKRKDPGKAVEFQLIAANIDYAFIMQAVDSNFNLNRFVQRPEIMSANMILFWPISAWWKPGWTPRSGASMLCASIQ